MADLSAIPTSNVFESFKKLTERPEIKKTTDRQDKIATLANSDGYKALCEVIDTWIESLRNIPIDPKTDDVESVGFRYLASQVTIEYLEDLKQMPERYKMLQENE